jgi:hypothetical protein
MIMVCTGPARSDFRRKDGTVFPPGLVLSRGDPLIFVQKPISLILLCAALLFLSLPYLLDKSRQLRLAREAVVDDENYPDTEGQFGQ